MNRNASYAPAGCCSIARPHRAARPSKRVLPIALQRARKMWLCVSTRFHRTLPRPGATIGCLADNSANAIGCASGVLSGSAGTFAKCVGGEHTADKWTSCAASANSDFARARNIATCVNPNKAACAAQYVGGDGAAFAACMAGGND